MKNTIKLLTGVLLAVILFVSCQKDEVEKNETKNYFKVGDTEYNLSDGLLENSGVDGNNNWYDGYLTRLTLISDGLSWQILDGDYKNLLGQGDIIDFLMFSTTGNTLDNKDYLFSSAEPHSVGTFGDGAYIINYVFDPMNFDEADRFKSGTVSVSRRDNEYNITIDGLSTNGKTITGFYKGKLRYADRTSY
jgi:hypothetical protein